MPTRHTFLATFRRKILAEVNIVTDGLHLEGSLYLYDVKDFEELAYFLSGNSLWRRDVHVITERDIDALLNK